MLHALGISLLGLGVAGLVVLAAHIAWQEFKTLRYVREMDEWAEDIR